MGRDRSLIPGPDALEPARGFIQVWRVTLGTLVQLASPLRTLLPVASTLGAFAPGVTVMPTAAAAGSLDGVDG
jgi:hypothetical protein